MRIISRSEWGARPAKYRHAIATPTPRLWLHHTAGALDAAGNGVWWDDVRGIQNFHMDGRGWSDIAYSFLVGGGQVFEGRGVGVAGGHTKGDNTGSHAICLIGNYEVMQPQQHDLDAIAWLVGHGQAQGWWGELTGPHRDAPGAETACCGRHLIARIPDLRRMAKEDDMPLTDDEIDRIAARTASAVRSGNLTHAGIDAPWKVVAVDTLRAAQIAAAKNVDVGALAEQIAARLPGTQGPVSITDLTAALREVLGSVDNV